MTLEEKAEEWRKNYKPMGVTCIERDWVVVETQAKPTKIIENPNPFRIKDGWYDLYLTDLENAYIAGAKENSIQWHDLRKNPNDLPKKIGEYLVYKISGYGSKSIELIQYNSNKYFWCVEHQNDVIAWCEMPQFKE